MTYNNEKKKDLKGLKDPNEESRGAWGQSEGRSYKDGMFRCLFQDKKNLIELFNALEGTSYDENTDLDIRTLEGIFSDGFRNDTGFEIDHLFLMLVEQQATICENIPLRLLVYVSRSYEEKVNRTEVYGRRRKELPYPKLVVLYNGTEAYDAEKEMKLSDSFPQRIGEKDRSALSLDVNVRVININFEVGHEILSKSPILYGYSYFVFLVRQHKKSGESLRKALRSAMESCLKEGFLVDFIEAHGGEIMGYWEQMFDEEVTRQLIRNAAYEDGREEGLEKGLEEGRTTGRAEGKAEGRAEGMAEGRAEGMEEERRKTVIRMLKLGISDGLISQAVGLSSEEVQRVKRLEAYTVHEDEDLSYCAAISKQKKAISN